MVSGEKGLALEGAVHAIEAVILQTSPSLREQPFRIETRKVINVGGVHHEIDVFVTVGIANGYESIFIFECKNWADPVGKNEIIVFAEKIKAVVAQHGYVVAPAFTKDAEAQAQQDPRIKLLISTEHDPALSAVPDKFHYTEPAGSKSLTTFHIAGSDGTTMTTVVIDETIMQLSGTDVPLRLYLEGWILDLYQRRLLSSWTADLPEGVHPMAASEERAFGPGQCIIDGKEMATVQLDAEFGVRIIRPTVLSDYEVSTRGRVIRLTPTTIRGDITTDTAFVKLTD
jgi:hypothetical protein